MPYRSDRDPNEPELKPMLHQGHRRPLTRRDFLAQGFMAGSAVIASPSLFGLLKGEASAQAACSLGTDIRVFVAQGLHQSGNHLVELEPGFAQGARRVGSDVSRRA